MHGGNEWPGVYLGHVRKLLAVSRLTDRSPTYKRNMSASSDVGSYVAQLRSLWTISGRLKLLRWPVEFS